MKNEMSRFSARSERVFNRGVIERTGVKNIGDLTKMIKRDLLLFMGMGYTFQHDT